MPYLLAGTIYPYWPIFAKPIKDTNVEVEKKYSAKQESARKDIERLFGVMKSYFQILRREIRVWEVEDIIVVADACIRLHKRIVSMQQNGEFSEEAGGHNLITEVYEHDLQYAQEAAVEYQNMLIAIAENFGDTWQEHVISMIINDVQ